MDVSTDARYRVGETSVYFADNIDGHPYLSAVYKSTLPDAIKKYPMPSYFVMSKEKFEIKDSAVYYWGRNIPIEQFKTEIKQIARIVDKP